MVPSLPADFMRSHDPLSYIDPRSRAFNTMNLPVPVPLLMPSNPMPMATNFFNPASGQLING
jgi:hypothetical protein